MIDKHATRAIVRKLFSWRSDRRNEGHAELQSLPPEHRLAVQGAVLVATVRDVKPGYGLIWLSALTFPVYLAIFATHDSFFSYWAATAALAIATPFLMRARFAWRHQSLASVLRGAIDKRLVPSLLAYRHRVGTRSGPKSHGYKSIIAALERLLPLVDEEDCLAWKHNTRQQLLDFLEGTPVRAAVTIQALRLAPAIGGSMTLSYVVRLVDKHEWGRAVPPEICIPLRKAASACEKALREAI